MALPFITEEPVGVMTEIMLELRHVPEKKLDAAIDKRLKLWAIDYNPDLYPDKQKNELANRHYYQNIGKRYITCGYCMLRRKEYDDEQILFGLMRQSPTSLYYRNVIQAVGNYYWELDKSRTDYQNPDHYFYSPKLAKEMKKEFAVTKDFLSPDRFNCLRENFDAFYDLVLHAGKHPSEKSRIYISAKNG